MKTTFVILSAVFVISAVGQYRDDHSSTVWQYDKYRAEIADVKRQELEAEQFNRTNTNPALAAMVTHHMLFQWTPKKGDIELGYRIDGVVVWRELPEGR